jgi:cytoskeletal protein CcmA (bactofilin family)
MPTLRGTTPVREVRSEPAVIGKAVLVRGAVYCCENLYVDGELEGAVELQECRLTVGSNVKLQADVKAREVVVLGSICGNIEAGERIDVRKSATVVGDVKTLLTESGPACRRVGCYSTVAPHGAIPLRRTQMLDFSRDQIGNA